MPEDLSPLIGIFWMISAANGARLLAASCMLDEAESYGDCLTFGPGHYEIWRGWRRSREQDAAAHAVVCAHEYDYFGVYTCLAVIPTTNQQKKISVSRMS